MTTLPRLLIAALLGISLTADRVIAQAFSSPDATYLAGTLPGLVSGSPMGPAIAYDNTGPNDPIPDTICVFGVCLVNGVGGFVVHTDFASKRAFAVLTGTGPWFLAQL